MGKSIVLRLSPTWVRFGTFEYFYSIDEYAKLQKLADYVIDESFPHLKEVDGLYLKMYEEIVKNTARTVAKWQSVGFNHGVMNTDNMSIDGRTIDYGPYAFLDDYNSSYICNHTDMQGRYSFKNQPGIAHWNLQQLAKALSPIVNLDKALEALESFGEVYEEEYLGIMYEKMGLYTMQDDEMKFLLWMLGALESSPIDYTKFFRLLSRYDGDKTDILELVDLENPIREWLEAYDKRLEKESLETKERHDRMLSINPKYILKNHILQEAIDKAELSDFSMIEDLLSVAMNPCEEHVELEHLCKSAPKEAKNLKLSCSS